MACVLFARAIGPAIVDVVVSERHRSSTEIADHPVEKGAAISDHMWRKPHEVVLEIAVSSPLAIISFETILRLQQSATMFTLLTGLKIYRNMVVQEFEGERDSEHAQILFGTAVCREIITVATQSSGGTGESLDTRAQAETNRGQVQAREITAGQGGYNDRFIESLQAAG